MVDSQVIKAAYMRRSLEVERPKPSADLQAAGHQMTLVSPRGVVDLNAHVTMSSGQALPSDRHSIKKPAASNIFFGGARAMPNEQ